MRHVSLGLLLQLLFLGKRRYLHIHDYMDADIHVHVRICRRWYAYTYFKHDNNEVKQYKLKTDTYLWFIIHFFLIKHERFDVQCENSLTDIFTKMFTHSHFLCVVSIRKANSNAQFSHSINHRNTTLT